MTKERGNESAAAQPTDGDEAADTLVGRVINDRYQVLEAIAQGGMGRVYLARQVPLGRTVALKVLQPNYHGNADPGFHKRFFLEAATCAKLSSPNTVTIFDYGSDGAVYYIAMEYLEGRTLHRELRKHGAVPLDRVFSITRQMCKSLSEAHAMGVIHRDLKPANIFLVERDADADEDDDFVKLIDFGLVKQVDSAAGEGLTKSGLFMGSPKYMSPEQIRNHELDARSDLYALGVVVYEMLTGRAPFVGKSDIDTLTAHLGQPPPPMATVNPNVAVPPEVEMVVRKALEKSPDDRFSNVDELYAAMKLALTGRMSVTPTGPMSIPSGIIPTPSGIQRLTEDDSPTVTKEPTLAPTFDSGPHRRSPRGRVLAGILLAVAGAAAVAALTIDGEQPGNTVVASEPRSSGREAANEDDVADPPVPQPEPPPAEPAAPPPVASVRLTLDSQPPGATVVINEREYGETPAEIELTGEQYAPGGSIAIRLQKNGYRDNVVSVPIDGPRLTVNADLEPITKRWPIRTGRQQQREEPPPSMWSPI